VIIEKNRAVSVIMEKNRAVSVIIQKRKTELFHVNLQWQNIAIELELPKMTNLPKMQTMV